MEPKWTNEDHKIMSHLFSSPFGGIISHRVQHLSVARPLIIPSPPTRKTWFWSTQKRSRKCRERFFFLSFQLPSAIATELSKHISCHFSGAEAATSAVGTKLTLFCQFLSFFVPAYLTRFPWSVPGSQAQMRPSYPHLKKRVLDQAKNNNAGPGSTFPCPGSCLIPLKLRTLEEAEEDRIL